MGRQQDRAIGAVIGHEISHTFDTEGSVFDSKGRVRDWWTPGDLAHFEAAADKLALQYDGYKPFPDNPKANFDIFARSFDPKTKKFGEPAKLSDSPENDVWPVATTDSEGHVWVAWQGARENVFRIFQRHQTKEGCSKAEQVSTQKRNCWAPAIASTKGKVAIAWDTYDKGDYDVWLREFADGKAAEARPVANSPDYEARPAMTYDKDGALWIAW